MSSKNGSVEHRAFRKVACERYGSKLMSSAGVLCAALQEPVCDRTHEDKEERLESGFWDRACLNAIRVLVYNLDPIEGYL